MRILERLNPWSVGSRAKRLVQRLGDLKADRELVRMGDSALPALSRALRAPEETTRAAACFVLAKIGSPSASDCLAEALHDEGASVRYEATVGLGHLRDSRAFEPLMDLFSKGDLRDRCTAALLLGHFGDSRAVETLQRLSGQANKTLKRFIADALARIRMRAEQPGAERLSNLDVLRHLDLSLQQGEMWQQPDCFGATREALASRWRLSDAVFTKRGNWLTCDVCSRRFSHEEQPACLQVPAVHIRELVRFGYNPLLNVWDPRRNLEGMDMKFATVQEVVLHKMREKTVEGIDRDGLESFYRFWKETAMKTASDWVLCPTCARDVSRWWWGD